METNNMNFVAKVYDDVLSQLDRALIGQKKVKKVVASSLLCDTNSRILLTGGTGFGKSTLSDFVATSFKTERIEVTSDLLPSEIQKSLTTSVIPEEENNSDIQKQVIEEKKFRLLQVEELNRANAKAQSAFIELFDKNQITTDERIYHFQDFYVIATQNNEEVAGIFNVPLAIYDRFGMSVSYDDLSEEELRNLLFGYFQPSKKSHLNEFFINTVKKEVESFHLTKVDEDMMLAICKKIDTMVLHNKKLFAGSNYRAHAFALKLVKLMALSSERNYLMPTDILDFIEPLYMHRINQNVAQIGDENVKELFDDMKLKIRNLNRKNPCFDDTKIYVKGFGKRK